MEDKPVVTQLMEDYGLNQRQAKYVFNLAKTGNQTQSHKDAGYTGTNDSHKANASKLIAKDYVRRAYLSLLHEYEPDRAEDFNLTKQKVVEDLEALKVQAFENIREGKGGGGAYSGFVKASELQGRELGMFAQKFKHEHDHSIIPTEDLLKRLAKSNPALAEQLGIQLGVTIDGECERVEN